ncbi:MAG: hypothetical protein QIT35_gp47 [Methanophagales virus PBV299]|uniref:Uncharacterized protein n=1 Tax=Methanophagales virus PBV299 TaxID=2987730 RepID=A0ABY6GLG5_9CAUD|nr:MAG: hypothetical protein QIT35_gp47 [Methanophagales virus PBV299]UYL64843.1 MAG: hypothetical protein OFDIEDLO_00047 [Methanophagales virus PBV299]
MEYNLSGINLLRSNIVMKASIFFEGSRIVRKLLERIFDAYSNGELDIGEIDLILQTHLPFLTESDRAEILDLLIKSKLEAELECP